MTAQALLDEGFDAFDTEAVQRLGQGLSQATATVVAVMQAKQQHQVLTHRWPPSSTRSRDRASGCS